MTLHTIKVILEWIITSELLAIIWIAILPQKKPENFFNYMPERKIVETSLEAWRSLTNEEISNTHAQILEALNVLGKGTFEDVAVYCKCSRDKIWKRMSELHRMELIYRNGEKKKLKSGRNGYVWMATGKALQKTTSKSTNPNPTTVSNLKQVAMDFTN